MTVSSNLAVTLLSLGFMKPNESFRFGHPGAFGAPGAGGAMGYADPEMRLGYGYVTSHMGMHLQGDPRDIALRNAIPEPRSATTRDPQSARVPIDA